VILSIKKNPNNLRNIEIKYLSDNFLKEAVKNNNVLDIIPVFFNFNF
jgi:hypothetical protein